MESMTESISKFKVVEEEISNESEVRINEIHEIKNAMLSELSNDEVVTKFLLVTPEDRTEARKIEKMKLGKRLDEISVQEGLISQALDGFQEMQVLLEDTLTGLVDLLKPRHEVTDSAEAHTSLSVEFKLHLHAVKDCIRKLSQAIQKTVDLENLLSSNINDNEEIQDTDSFDTLETLEEADFDVKAEIFDEELEKIEQINKYKEDDLNVDENDLDAITTLENDNMGLVKDEGDSSVKYECKECEKQFDRKSSWITHMRSHTGEKPYPCSICEKSFSQKGHLNDHMILHTGAKAFKCNFCDKKFSRMYSKKCHETTHTSNKPFKCTLCDKSFGVKNTLNNHMKTHSNEKPYKCDVCGNGFVALHVLQVHMRHHTGEKPFKCDQCPKMFVQKGSLTDHMKTHTGVRPYKCDQCVKSFAHESTLKSHLRTHTGEKPFNCEHCQKKFAHRSGLIHHMRIHTGEKPYSCDQCDKKYTQSGQLKYHMRQHTGERPYKCTICNKGFRDSSTLKVHTYLHKKQSCDVNQLRDDTSSSLVQDQAC